MGKIAQGCSTEYKQKGRTNFLVKRGDHMVVTASLLLGKISQRKLSSSKFSIIVQSNKLVKILAKGG